MHIETDRLRSGLDVAVGRLLGAMRPEGYWEGELSSSALATATAISALATTETVRHERLIRAGVRWLCDDQNADGGWGDSPESPSNLSTTMLAVAALTLCAGENAAGALTEAEAYLCRHAGRSIDQRIDALTKSYGKDHTFAVPILVNCAIAGLVPWSRIQRLPFELAVLPHASYSFLRLHVVSYALPALIAVGLALHRRNPTRNPITRALRGLAEGPALRRLETIQPASGGFLEAVPLTSFVAMSLASASHAGHPVTQGCLDFLVATARPDGSWPIDSNLSVWLTTGAVIALDAAGALSKIDVERTRQWLRHQQHPTPHPYTNAAPGGWAWTHLPGGVPDADDTARALFVMHVLGQFQMARSEVKGSFTAHNGSPRPTSPELIWEHPAAAPHHVPEMSPCDQSNESTDASANDGIRWLLDLQNRDGGWPTFCRGWARLPFDRSSPDLTAHALQALHAAHPDKRRARVERAVQNGLRYLGRTQRSDGSWTPLWFGNQDTPDHLNPVLGTASVLPALLELSEPTCSVKAVAYLVAVQNTNGGWGGDAGITSSVEETAAGVSALAQAADQPETHAAVSRGANYLLGRIEKGSWCTTSPIGLYFAKLWYSEQLYPIIWTVDALGRVAANRKTENG